MATEDFKPVSLRTLADAFKVYAPYVEQYGVTPDLITALIKEHEPIKAQLQYFRADYEASEDGVPILTRTIKTSSGNPIETFINNKLNNSFSSEIVDTLNGYFLGLPINYVVEKEKVRKADTLIDAIDKMRVRDNLPDKDATYGKRADIGGYSARLAYIGLENDKPVHRIANLKPEEVIIIYNESMSEPRYAMHYYDTAIVQADGSKVNATIADFYDNLNITRFTKTDGDFVQTEVKMHGFDFVPLFGLENNDELSAAVQRVLNLKTAFDRTISDASNEIEASRLAILLLQNFPISKNDIEQMKANGILSGFDGGGSKMDARYLTKDVNDTMIENHLNRLDKNIVRFAKSIDFTDENFTKDLSGIAILFKTMALEHKAIIAENKMRSSLQYQMKVLCSGWAKLGICDPEDYLSIWFGFKRNIPKNTYEIAQTIQLLDGKVSRRTLLSLLPFIDDIEAEEVQLELERKQFGDDLLPIGTPKETNTNINDE